MKNPFLFPFRGSFLLLTGAGGLVSCQSPVAEKPNFLFILVDDLGYMDVGFNNPDCFYETPNLDRLATESIRFTRAYAACPVCSPTRASIMTGKYPARLHTTDYFGAPQPGRILENPHPRFAELPLLPAPYVEKLPLEEVTVAKAFKEAGYATFFAGKWHLGPEGYWPEDQGFDVNQGGIERGGPYGGNRYFSPYGNPRLTDGPDGEHLPDRLAYETVRFIADHKDQSWFAFLSFYSVHTPLMTRKDLEDKYREKARNALPDEWGVEGERKVRMVQNHAVYAGMVESMDLAVGKVLDYLKANGLDQNTVVVFMSDNGGLSTSEGHPTSNLPLRAGKGWLYEGGIREPMLIKWHGKHSSVKECDHPVISTDFYPTMLEMAGLDFKPEQHADGISMVSLMSRRPKSAAHSDRPLFFHYPHWGNQGGTPGAAIILGRYKLIEFFGHVVDGDSLVAGVKSAELYDLMDDPGELRNLADEQRDRVDQMSVMLHEWQEEMGAAFPSINPLYLE